jgi:2-phosphosulfolactate phosphatase
MKIQTTLTPAEFESILSADLPETACVVFDILRATSTFVTALHEGAKEIIAVREIAEAVVFLETRGDILLAGERDGVKINAARSGGKDFDLGNSPREFVRKKIEGRTIVSTTTNGTRALRACAGAKCVLAASLLNLTATADFLEQKGFGRVLLVCAGTGQHAALEDILAAGALAELMAARGLAGNPDSPFPDATETARRVYLQARPDFATVFDQTQNARRLGAIPELKGDVAFCRQQDVFPLVAVMGIDGAIRKL